MLPVHFFQIEQVNDLEFRMLETIFNFDPCTSLMYITEKNGLKSNRGSQPIFR